VTYRALDKRRFTYLLSLGTAEVELRKFFSDCRIQLIQRGAKVQNLPTGDKARIRALAYDLPSSTDDVVSTWFSQNITMSDPEAAEVIVETFKLHEEVGEGVEEEEARRLARSCLVHLFSDPVPPPLLEFLRSPNGGAAKMEEQPKGFPHADKSVELTKVAQVFSDLVQGQDVERHVDGLPIELAAVAVGLQAASQGRLKEANEALGSLPDGAAGRGQLDQYVKQQEARGLKELPKGPAVAESEPFGGTFDFENDEILGYCTNADPPKAVFVHPIAVVRAANVRLLSGELKRALFPNSGDLISFAGPGHPNQPRRGEIGIWRVAEHQTDKATHFHITGEVRKVYELVTIPFPTTEYDSVREYIKEHSERTAGKLSQPLLFVLSDGLIVGPQSERSDLLKEDTFESGLLSWDTLPSLRLEGRQFALAPLPKEQGIYECASLASSVRKLLRTHIGAGNRSSLGLTKAQLSELVQILRSNEAHLSASRLQRIQTELNRIDQNKEALEALVQELLPHPSLKHRIQELVQEEANRQTANKSQVQGEIARLQKERTDWEDRVRKQKEEHRKLREDTSKVVKAAFEKARTDGVATLAELAIFQELTAPSGQRSAEGVRFGANFQPILRPLTKSATQVANVLQALGISSQKAAAFAATGEAAFGAGLIVSLTGVAARLATERWAQSIGSGILIDVVVGLLDDSPIRTVLNGSARPEVIAILDANLSALDIYARPISDLIVDTMSKTEACGPPSILCAMSDGVGHLPVPKTFERLSISINLDGKYDFANPNVAELMQHLFDIEDGVLRTKLWGPAVKRLHAELAKLDAETQALVLPVLSVQ